MNIAYEKAIQKMVERVSQMAKGDWTPTPTMKECLRVAKVLEDAANTLADTSAAMDIERMHKRRGDPDYSEGPDTPSHIPDDALIAEEKIPYLNVVRMINGRRSEARVAGQKAPAAPQPPGPGDTGLDGLPVPHDEVNWPCYEAIKWQMRTLAESARKAAADLPDPRYKPALPSAALAMLHIRHDHGFPPATSYIGGEGAIELERIAHESGIAASRESCQKALQKALKEFDPQYRPPDLYGLV